MCQPIIIYGPQGCGKSQHAEVFMRAFGCSRLVDGWSPWVPLQPGDLALTNVELPICPGARILGFEEALRLAISALESCRA